MTSTSASSCPSSLVGRCVRTSFARPVDLNGYHVARLEGVFGGIGEVPATFTTRAFTLHTITSAVDPEGNDITHAARLSYATVTAGLDNLAAIEFVPREDDA
jgi:hypothetical protein